MFTIKIADFIIGIDNKHSYIENLCKNYITNEKDILFTVCASPEEIRVEANFSDDKFTEGYLESICIYRKICLKLPKYDAFLLHASIVKISGNGFALCGKSGSGKSTHTKLLKQLLGDELSIINGDKPIIRLIDGSFFAYGTPWAGKENWNTNDFAPLKSLFLIEQNEKNSIEQLTPQQAVNFILHQVLMPKGTFEIGRLLEMVDDMLNKIDLYVLKCNISNEAALTSYRTIKGDNIDEN